jgi:hypothetical protein
VVFPSTEPQKRPKMGEADWSDSQLPGHLSKVEVAMGGWQRWVVRPQRAAGKA